MRLRLLVVPLVVPLVVLFWSGCRCGGTVATVRPTLRVTPLSVAFGPVKVGSSHLSTLKLEAQTKTSVAITGVTVANGGAPGGAEGFKVTRTPTAIGSLSSEELDVSFFPTSAQAYEAVLTVASDDPEHATVEVLLTGEGSQAQIAVTPDCAVARKCVGTVTVMPPSIEFPPEPFVRLLPVDVSTLPSVNILNEGLVDLQVSAVAFQGPDAAAFAIPGNATFPAAGLLLKPAEGRSLSVRFTPSSEAQQSYSAQMVISSDDPARPKVTVNLTGTLRPNLAPVVCANLIKVQPIDDSPLDYSTQAEWATLSAAPAGGYDFTTRRNVEPRAVVIFSAISDLADQTRCTSDPEDGRLMLTYSWKLISAPTGAMSLGISGATTPQATLRPIVTGEYTLELTVKDVQMHATAVTMKFAVALKQDLVAQLQWPGFGEVDLDLHLVRPSAATQPADPFSGVFAFFEAGDAGHTSGDVNGYSVIKKANTPSFDFDWGNVGTPDDPRLNIDDTGSGTLLENVSLNYPENDPKCATTNCTYKVLVHYFKDARVQVAPLACIIDGGTDCADGLGCSCTSGQRCVADSAPRGDAGVGVGKCFAPPKPVVRIFLKGSAIAAATIPLERLTPPDELAIGAPCQMLYVADIEWPAKTLLGSLPDGGTPLANVFPRGADAGRIVSPQLARFGWRQTGGSLQCSPDTTKGAAVDWYSRQP